MSTVQRTREQIMAEATEVLEEISRIKEQIARAKGAAAGEGKYADSDWFQRTNRALRHRQVHHQKLLQEAGALRRAQMACADQEFERRFVNAAKAALTGEQFRELVDKANGLSADGYSVDLSARAKRLSEDKPDTEVASDAMDWMTSAEGLLLECARFLDRPDVRSGLSKIGSAV